jgi:predicted transcriptional regulator
MALRDDLFSIGPVESEIMDVMWRIGEASGRKVSDFMPHRLPYTTVMSAMARLVDKGLLKRNTRGTAFYYEPLFSREDYPKERMRRVITYLLAGPATRDALYSCFLDTFFHDPAELDELQRKIDLRRAEL